MTATWIPVFDWDNDGWRDSAACRHTDANLFFPAGSTGMAIDVIEHAKTVCRACPVQRACLEFAFETNQEAGIWGGTDEDERRKLRREWRARRSPRPKSATS
jgi:WhiB family redox-sensing transcriptional regulator